LPIRNSETENYPGHDIDLYVENQNFSTGSILLLPETVKIDEYPITKEEYNYIKSNPYGIILVDGVPCYIKEIKYKRQKYGFF
jgi:hypothetical protein